MSNKIWYFSSAFMLIHLPCVSNAVQIAQKMFTTLKQLSKYFCALYNAMMIQRKSSIKIGSNNFFISFYWNLWFRSGKFGSNAITVCTIHASRHLNPSYILFNIESHKIHQSQISFLCAWNDDFFPFLSIFICICVCFIKRILIKNFYRFILLKLCK